MLRYLLVVLAGVIAGVGLAFSLLDLSLTGNFAIEAAAETGLFDSKATNGQQLLRSSQSVTSDRSAALDSSSVTEPEFDLVRLKEVESDVRARFQMDLQSMVSVENAILIDKLARVSPPAALAFLNEQSIFGNTYREMVLANWATRNIDSFVDYVLDGNSPQIPIESLLYQPNIKNARRYAELVSELDSEHTPVDEIVSYSSLSPVQKIEKLSSLSLQTRNHAYFDLTNTLPIEQLDLLVKKIGEIENKIEYSRRLGSIISNRLSRFPEKALAFAKQYGDGGSPEMNAAMRVFQETDHPQSLSRLKQHVDEGGDATMIRNYFVNISNFSLDRAIALASMLEDDHRTTAFRGVAVYHLRRQPDEALEFILSQTEKDQSVVDAYIGEMVIQNPDAANELLATGPPEDIGRALVFNIAESRWYGDKSAAIKFAESHGYNDFEDEMEEKSRLRREEIAAWKARAKGI